MHASRKVDDDFTTRECIAPIVSFVNATDYDALNPRGKIADRASDSSHYFSSQFICKSRCTSADPTKPFAPVTSTFIQCPF
jgi:hypothetical protein